MAERPALCDDSRVSRRVVIVDDHASFRASARRLLELEGWTVVGEAADGASAYETVERLQPDLVLLDVALPDASGFDVAERLGNSTSRIVLVSRDPSDFGARILRSGAAGSIPKGRAFRRSAASLLGGTR